MGEPLAFACAGGEEGEGELNHFAIFGFADGKTRFDAVDTIVFHCVVTTWMELLGFTLNTMSPDLSVR